MTAQAIRIGSAHVGAPVDVHTALLVGSIFYDRHSVVRDPFEGTFEEQRAGALLDDAARWATRYGVQMAVDVVAATPRAMDSYLRFVLPRSPLPVLINATEAEARVAGLTVAAEMGALDRCIYASLTEDVESVELEALGRHRPAAVMILASDICDPSPDGSVAMIRRFFAPLLKELGIETPIVDVGTFDAPSIGLAMAAISAVRGRLGYPAGCAFANCLPQWSALTAMGPRWVEVSFSATVAAVRGAGASFLHYGLIERARLAAHAAATA
jgi:tetrahydromethanopterin S-methyltransferase subunit H